jgi:ABC-type Fe3+/spermidine/putrescine transport system ATPase subunit
MNSTPNTGTASPTPGTEPSCGRADPPPADAVGLAGLAFGYGSALLLRDVSLGVPAGRFLTLLGPSGCGKTTLLKLIGGYLAPAAGRVFLRGRDVTALPPEGRNVGMVFQNYALFPHLSARRNVAFGLEVRGVPRAERDRRVEAMLDLVGLSAGERDRRPAALSGGQQQRVALARALVFAPEVLLLDEPLANLDRHLRDQLRAELRRLQRETAVAAVMVTHDQEEALAVSDLLGVLAAGRLLQVGPPAELYDRPRTPFVARFLGDANLLPGPALGGEAGGVMMVRPERCVLGPAAAACPWSWDGRIASVTFLGADVLAEVACAAGLTLRVRSRPAEEVRPGERVRVGIPSGAAWAIPDPDPAEGPA